MKKVEWNKDLEELMEEELCLVLKCFTTMLSITNMCDLEVATMSAWGFDHTKALRHSH